MKNKLAFLLPLTVFLLACQPSVDAPVQTSEKSWTVAVIEVPTSTLLEYTVAGSVISDQRVELTSKLSGYILEVLAQEGDQVRRGQALVRIDAAEVEGGIRQSRAVVSSTDAAFRNAQTDLDRYRQLFERGSISDNEWRRVQLQFNAAREALNQAQASFDTARAQFDYAVIKSPIDGVVVARAKHQGDLAIPGQSILTVESVRNLVFETFVPDSQIGTVKPGKQVNVQIDGLPEPVTGTVDRVVPSSDPITRTHQVKLRLPPVTGLTSGMFGRALLMPATSQSTVIPRQTLVERGGLRGVFVVDAESRARFRWLRTGREWPDLVEVTTGLLPGERILVAVDPKLRDGDRIVTAQAKA